MTTLIFRASAPIVIAIMAVFSVYVCLRGHNEPGGGFIGGLIAASAVAVYAMAFGAAAARGALRLDPLALAGGGLFLAGLSGLVSLFASAPFMTGLWWLAGEGVALSTPLVFDIGVYLVVFGALSAVALALDGGEGEAE